MRDLGLGEGCGMRGKCGEEKRGSCGEKRRGNAVRRRGEMRGKSIIR